MKNQNSNNFALLVSSFLTDYLPLQRGYSENTVKSYRDTLKLFLRYVNEKTEKPIKAFETKDFTKELVISFLEDYRKNGASTSAANQRLAALKTFASYAQIESLECMSSLSRVTDIKATKYTSREIHYLTAEQTSKLINKPGLSSFTEFRHRVVMTLLYDSGCRVQELCDINIGDIFINTDTTVRLHGKGDKYRTVIVSDETGKLIRAYLNKFRVHALKTDPLIINRNRTRMNRDGVSYIIGKYASKLHSEDNSFPANIHCHMLRHSKAMHMLEAGINIVIIRDFLGHEEITTTMIYAKADNRKKKEVIEALAPKLTGTTELPDWTEDNDLLNFLDSLK